MVIGAGVVGACTAHYLSQQGWRVIVVERRAAPALETSFANGGQLSACHATPWSNPRAPWKVLKWAFDPESPLCFRPRVDPHQWRWLARFLLNCAPGRSARNTETLLKLALFSRQAYHELFDQLHVTDNVKDLGIRKEGIIHFYRTHDEYYDGARDAKLFTQLGLIRRLLKPDQLVKLEPSLEPIGWQLVGGTYTASDMSGDARAFTEELERFSSLAPDKFGHVNVKYHYLTEVERLFTDGSKVGVQLRNRGALSKFRECYVPDALVLCTATGTNELLRPLKLKTLIYPAKGYSASFQLSQDSQKCAPKISLTDDELKVVYTRLQPNILRVAGTAELSGYDDETLRFERCQALVRSTKSVFPQLDLDTYAFWTGLRPLTPSNVPYISGFDQHPNLYLNTGHGSLGWTLAAGSAKLLAELVEKRTENVPVPNTSLQLDLQAFDYKTPR